MPIRQEYQVSVGPLSYQDLLLALAYRCFGNASDELKQEVLFRIAEVETAADAYRLITWIKS